MQNADTASLAASAWTVSEAIADGDLSEKSNEDYDDCEEENDGDEGEDSDYEDNEADDTNKPEGEDQANWFEGLVDSSLLEDDVLLSRVMFFGFVARVLGETQRWVGLLVSILTT